jgi:hypothetical protein
MALPELEVDDPRRLTVLDEPDDLGATAWVVTYINEAGNVCSLDEAVAWSADGYDERGERVAGQHGVIDSPAHLS